MKNLISTLAFIFVLSACGQSQAADQGSTGSAVLGAERTALESEEAINEAVASGIVLLKFGAEWCPPCRQIAPELVDLAKERDDLTVVDVDTDQHPEVARAYSVQSIPALYVLRDGKVLASKVGYHSKQALGSWVDQTVQ